MHELERMIEDDKVQGRKFIAAYFDCSWNTAKKHCLEINDKSIFYYTIAGKPTLIPSKYEKKYGSPKRLPQCVEA